MVLLDSVDSIPEDLAKWINPLRESLVKSRCIDVVANRAMARPALKSITEYLEAPGIIAVHYTRAQRDDILANGLTCLSGEERRAAFLKNHGHRFSEEELSQIQACWRQFFTPSQNAVRDNRVFFNLTTVALSDGGAAPLLENYGGEVLYMPLRNLPRPSETIKSLGVPLVVKCHLKPSQLCGCWEFPAAVVWLSAYQKTINPNARIYDVDVHIKTAVPADRIVSVESPAHWA